MARFLVQIHSGPTAANTVTLGAFIAAEAARQGHRVTLFFAGDGVACLPPAVRSGLEGQGTGRLADHLAALGAHGGRLVASRRSADGRGLGDAPLADLPQGLAADWGTPIMLVDLAAAADTVLSY